jgi:tight adherence protein C
MRLLLAFLIAVIVFCSYLLVDQYRLMVKRREMMRARITPDGSNQSYDEESLTLVDGEPSPRAKGMLGLLRALGVNVDELLPKLSKRFGQAGIPGPDGPIFYLFFQRIISIVLLVLVAVYILQPVEGMQRLLHYSAGGFIAILAVFGPYLYVQNKIDHRRQKLERAFPDTLDLLLICVESGLALDAALNRVCAELGAAYPEITEELNRTRLELSLLNDRVKALMNLGERTNMVAFRSLTAALIQSERFGTALTDTLRVLSEDFRLLRLSQAEAKAARLPVILTIPLIFFLMPAFMLIILGPAIVRFARQGQMVTGQ